MRCKKCGGLCRADKEFTHIGSVDTVVCYLCGWRGPILDDKRIKLNIAAEPPGSQEELGPALEQKREVTVAVLIKKICVGCGRPMQIVDKEGHCARCYSRLKKGQPLTGDLPAVSKQPTPAPAPDPAPQKEQPVTEPATPPAATPPPAVKNERKPLIQRCFFCGEDHERLNEVGRISFNDGEHDRNIFVCHYCASECLKDMLKLNRDRITTVVGALMYDRALDSRSW